MFLKDFRDIFGRRLIYAKINDMFSKRVDGIDSSFIRDILKLTKSRDIISFAGGLPDPELFPTEEFAHAAQTILSNRQSAKEALQYGPSPGYEPLLEIISKSYDKKDNLKIDPNLIIITNGSQQALDLIAKIFINEGDGVLIENPTYLAAIQSLSFFKPKFYPVDTESDGPTLSSLPEAVGAKMFYTIPNFQNPSGVTWSNSKRQAIADYAQRENLILIEDDPYGEIRFAGERQKPLKTFYEKTILLGSFSKILAPGLRLGWMIAPDREIYEKLILAKQAADLHTSQFTQMIAAEFYKHFDAQGHIDKIAESYKSRKETMQEALGEQLPDLMLSNPEGGMFLWASFPDDVDTQELLEFAVKEGVAFVPGVAFSCQKGGLKNSARLNFTNADHDQIIEGVKRLKRAYEKYKNQ